MRVILVAEYDAPDDAVMAAFSQAVRAGEPQPKREWVAIRGPADAVVALLTPRPTQAQKGNTP